MSSRRVFLSADILMNDKTKTYVLFHDCRGLEVHSAHLRDPGLLSTTAIEPDDQPQVTEMMLCVCSFERSPLVTKIKCATATK